MQGNAFGRWCREKMDAAKIQTERETILEALDWAIEAKNDLTGRWGYEARQAMAQPADQLEWNEGDLDPEIIDNVIIID